MTNRIIRIIPSPAIWSVIMEDHKREWWVSEISEKFRALNTILFSFCSIMWAVQFSAHVLGFFDFNSYTLCFKFLFIPVTFGAFYLESIPAYAKVTYVLIISEYFNFILLKMAEQNSESEMALRTTAGIFIIYLQLSIFYSKLSTSILIFKLQYQWCFKTLLSNSHDMERLTIPVLAMVASMIIYQYYRDFEMKFSYNSFCANKKLKESKKEISTLLKLIPGGLLVLTQDLKIQECTQNALHYLQATSDTILDKLEDIQYMPNKKMNNLTPNNYILSDIKQCFYEEENFEHVLGVSQGNLEWRSKHISWIGRKAVVIIIQNIDKIVTLEKHSNEILFKNLLLSSASHELRNPTITISEYSSNMIEQENYLSQKSQDSLRIISNNSKLLLSLIGDILDFSTMVSGDFSIQKRDCDLLELIDDCYDLFKLQIFHKDLLFKTRIDPDLPRTIYTDPVRLKQIIINLLSNAKKFTLTGLIEICVVETSERKIRISVRDTGVGIEQNSLESIFKAFKSNKDSELNCEGCGLGLTVSNLLAFKLGEESIKVRSRINQGSLFSFKVLTKRGNDREEEEKEEEEEEEEEKEDEKETESDESDHDTHNSPLNFPSDSISFSQVLIVDDESSIRTILANILNNANISWSEAKSGKEAIEKVSKHDSMGRSFFVVIMDIEMAGIDGWTACRKIRENESILKQPFIIGHSANYSEEYLEHCYFMGMNLVMKKPSKAKDIINAILPILE